MAKYIERLKDGTERVVTYNPHHDGPVSERLYWEHKVLWLSRVCKRHPANMRRKQELHHAKAQLRFYLKAAQEGKFCQCNTGSHGTRAPQRLSLRSAVSSNGPGNGELNMLLPSNLRFNKAEKCPRGCESAP